MFVRSTLPGSCSFGHTWHGPGDVVEMDADQAAELVAIEPDRFEAFNEDPRDTDEKATKDKASDEAKTAAKKTAASRTKAVTESD